MTVDWAMCCLIRDDLAQFYKLYKSYAAHASPTHGWPECIYVESRLGTGDTPHGWAAASYVLMHRNAFVYENEDALELCWGVHPEWLVDGAHFSVKRAPTRFGTLDLEMKRSGAALSLEYKLAPLTGQPKPREVRVHIPLGVRDEVRSIRINGTEQRVSAGIKIGWGRAMPCRVVHDPDRAPGPVLRQGGCRATCTISAMCTLGITATA